MTCARLILKFSAMPIIAALGKTISTLIEDFGACTDDAVKLSIKSFTVPELFVDLPESASVANLKKAVMDAAMNLLGGGLRVRVLMQGKKVPDEAATLSQMGISRNAKPESLGFMLEPSPVPTSASATAEDPLLVLSRAAHQPSPRYSFDWSSFINFNSITYLHCLWLFYTLDLIVRL